MERPPGRVARIERLKDVRPGSPAAIDWKNVNMGLGNKKGHVHGSQVSGGHTTLIHGADAIVKKLGLLPWFVSVRPGVIRMGAEQYSSA